MAVVSAIKAKTQSKTATGKVVAYVIQKKKTLFHDKETDQKYRLISGQNCVAETAFKEFMATKIQYGKDNGVFYKHFVQSFKPGETASPKEIHQMGVELAEYFKGFEVVVATHIDADHWHNHLIVNSVNADTGLKIQFSERNFNQLRQQSDEVCKAHGLNVLKAYQKETPVAGMNTREYRAAERGNSWKFKLISAIDMALDASPTKADFIANMEHMGYGVKWIDHYKYITYTTPEGQKCRDNRLHEEKYLKERMEQFYDQAFRRTHRQAQKLDMQEKIALLPTWEDWRTQIMPTVETAMSVHTEAVRACENSLRRDFQNQGEQQRNSLSALMDRKISGLEQTLKARDNTPAKLRWKWIGIGAALPVLLSGLLWLLKLFL